MRDSEIRVVERFEVVGQDGRRRAAERLQLFEPHPRAGDKLFPTEQGFRLADTGEEIVQEAPDMFRARTLAGDVFRRATDGEQP